MTMALPADYLGNSIGPLSMSVLGADEKFLTQNTNLNEGTEYTSRHPSSRHTRHQSVGVAGSVALTLSEGGGSTSMLPLVMMERVRVSRAVAMITYAKILYFY